jgi:kynurenine formamidase
MKIDLCSLYPGPFFLWSIICLLLGTSAAAQSPHEKLTKRDIDRWAAEISNWNRWGKDDQLGAVNLITPEKRKEAARLVREGISISIAHHAVTKSAIDNPHPFIHQMHETGANSESAASDTYSVRYHGMVHTHMDALCHLFYQGKTYNGYAKEMVTEKGAEKLGVENLKNGIFTRAILFDIPALKNVEYLEPRTAIYPEDLDAWEKKIGVKAGPGDVILIRTGRWARRNAKGPWDVSELAGLHASCAKWIRQRDISILGSDSASDVQPSGVEGVQMPIHQLMLNTLGIWILDNADLEEISKIAGQRKRYDFLITMGPLPVKGGTGSPLNPILTF